MDKKQSDSVISLLDFIADPVVLLDFNGNVVAVNRASEKCMGIKKEEAVGRSLFSIGLLFNEKTTNNAVDAMPDGGKIIVESCPTEEALEISFSDNGLGISSEILPKLFSPLFTTKAKGIGFGLAICKRIVEAHNGTIAVSTTKDQGTSFTLILPYEPKMKSGGENIWINIPESSLSTTTKLFAQP